MHAWLNRNDGRNAVNLVRSREGTENNAPGGAVDPLYRPLFARGTESRTGLDSTLVLVCSVMGGAL
jgi:hypothetical protein